MTGVAGYVLLLTAAAVLAYLLSPVSARLAVWCGAVDMPGDRKVHQHPMPRLGGLAVVASAVAVITAAQFAGVPVWIVPPVLITGLLAGLGPVVFVSLVDDIRPVPARVKFLFHVAGAVAAVAAGISLPHQVHLLGQQIAIGWLAAPVSVLWIVGVTNAFNIIDGLDGLSAGLAFISSVAMSAVFFVVGEPDSALVPLALAGAIAGFLPFNLYPARMFLGDTGATAIGFCLSVVALEGGSTMSAGFAAAMPVLLMGLPVADTLVAIGRRLVRKAERATGGVFQPDRNHIHHRLLALGLDHRTAVFSLYGFGAVMALVAFVSLFLSNRESALLLFTLLTAAFIGIKRLGYDEFALIRKGTILRIYEAPVLRRSLFVAFVDMAFVAFSVYVAIGLKTDDWMLATHGSMAWQLIVFLAPASVLVFWRARLYEGSWRLATIDDYTRAFSACAVSAVIALVVFAWQFQIVPASLLVVYGLVSSMVVVGSRASYRVLVSARQRTGRKGIAVLLYGPGPEDLVGARDMIERTVASGMRPVGLLSPYRGFKGRFVDGLKVWGGIDELPQIVGRAGAQAVVIADHAASSDVVDRLSGLCRQTAVALYRLHVSLESLAGPVQLVQDSESSRQSTTDEAGQPCPSCGANALRRSRSRGVEQLRRKLTTRRVFRCDACQWRGWREPVETAARALEPLHAGLDLSVLDDHPVAAPLLGSSADSSP